MKEFNIDVYGHISFPSLKELPKDEVIHFTLSKNITFKVDENLNSDIPSGEDFNIISKTKDGSTVRLHNCRVCSRSFNKSNVSIQVNYDMIEVFGPMNWRNQRLNSLI
jgi:hypothetical protein